MLKNGEQQQEKIKNVYVEGGVFLMDWKSTGLTPATTPNASANNTPINSPQKAPKSDSNQKIKSNSIPIGKNPKKLTFSYDNLSSFPSDQAAGPLNHIQTDNIIAKIGEPATTNKNTL